MEAQNIQIADFIHTPVIDQVGINDRVERFNARSIKKDSKMTALKLALSMIDLTTLEGMDTAGESPAIMHKSEKFAQWD
jgi:deoxyribose-phosphate aldolase